jgi:hypothetical protein
MPTPERPGPPQRHQIQQTPEQRKATLELARLNIIGQIGTDEQFESEQAAQRALAIANREALKADLKAVEDALAQAAEPPVVEQPAPKSSRKRG